MLDPKYEQKVLKQTLKLFQEPEKQQRQCELLKYLLYALGTVLIVCGYVVTANWKLGHFLNAMGGTAIGVAAFMGTAQKQWPVISPHISRESLESRLRELEK